MGVLHIACVVFAHLETIPSYRYPRDPLMCQYITRPPMKHVHLCFGRSLIQCVVLVTQNNALEV
jgi:hypothetical protein